MYVIYNFINEYLEGYYKNGTPSLTPFGEDAMQMNLNTAEIHLKALHEIGYIGLRIKEYDAGLYD